VLAACTGGPHFFDLIAHAEVADVAAGVRLQTFLQAVF
jgi:hypothetical protein